MANNKEDDIRDWIKKKLNIQKRLHNQILEDNVVQYNILKNLDNQTNNIENSQSESDKGGNETNNETLSYSRSRFKLDIDFLLLAIGFIEIAFFVYLLIKYFYF